MMKRGTGMFVAWKERLFMLTSKQLVYFDAGRLSGVKGSMLLRNVKVFDMAIPLSKYGKKLCLTLTPHAGASAVWVLQTDTEQDFIRWRDALRHAIGMQAVNNFFMLSTHVPPCILRAYSHTQRVSTRCRSAPALVTQCARASLYYPTLLKSTRGSKPRPVHVGRRHLRQSCHRFWRFWRSGRSTARGNRQGRHPGCCRCCSKERGRDWGGGA